MITTSDMRGFSLLELLVASTLSLAVVGAALTLFSQARSTTMHIDTRTNIQSNLALTMEQIKKDLRSVGYGVPAGARAGGSDSWAPALFHATPTTLAFRADTDGGNSVITCTPRTASSRCPLTTIHVDEIDYYDALGCSAADGSGGALALVAVFDDDLWSPLTCSAVDSSRMELTTTAVPDRLFEGGRSALYSIEQVYLRYVPGVAPDYGRLERAVRYGNTPNGSFPPSGVTWETVARQLNDVLFEYRDETDAVISGHPLSAANRARVRSMTVVLEGFDQPGASARSHTIPIRSRVALRNLR